MTVPPINLDLHLDRLKGMFLRAPVNRLFRPEVTVSRGEATIRMVVSPEFFHPAGSAHGVVYFKLLDSSCFLAANSVIQDVIVFTVQFSIYFMRPIRTGEVHAVARITHQTKSLITCEAKLIANGEIMAEGMGIFKRSSIALTEAIGYF